MIRKSGYRFSEQDHAPAKDLERDDDSTETGRALALAKEHQSRRKIKKHGSRRARAALA
jgi:hypothetical protein